MMLMAIEMEVCAELRWSGTYNTSVLMFLLIRYKCHFWVTTFAHKILDSNTEWRFPSPVRKMLFPVPYFVDFNNLLAVLTS
jgi:hypothetical protein